MMIELEVILMNTEAVANKTESSLSPNSMIHDTLFV